MRLNILQEQNRNRNKLRYETSYHSLKNYSNGTFNLTCEQNDMSLNRFSSIMDFLSGDMRDISCLPIWNSMVRFFSRCFWSMRLSTDPAFFASSATSPDSDSTLPPCCNWAAWFARSFSLQKQQNHNVYS